MRFEENKRDVKEHIKDSMQNNTTHVHVEDHKEKLKKRKLQNRIAAQKSRERKKEKMNELEQENKELMIKVNYLNKVLESYHEQIISIKDWLSQSWWVQWKSALQSEFVLKSDKYINSSNLSELKPIPEISNKTILQRASSTLTMNSQVHSTTNTSSDDIEVDQEENEISRGECFKLPKQKKKGQAAISIAINSNIPLNIFTIFWSLLLVGWFMVVCFVFDETVIKHGNVGQMLPKRVLRETETAEISVPDLRSFNTPQFDNYSSNPELLRNEEYLSFIKSQRYNFFSKVESDALEEPENDTLQVFKPDEKESAVNIQQKLYERKMKLNDLDFIEQKNKKYNHIESLVWDQSVMFSEDMKFLFGSELNYLHLLVKTSGVKLVNSNMKEQDVDQREGDDDFIEVGCKVFSTSFTSFLH